MAIRLTDELFAQTVKGKLAGAEQIFDNNENQHDINESFRKSINDIQALTEDEVIAIISDSEETLVV